MTRIHLVRLNYHGIQIGTCTLYGDVLCAIGPGDAVGANVYRHQLGFIDDNAGGAGWTKHGIRWNDNTTGTWTTQDPLTFVLEPESGNRYLFANGDPINNTDPTGRNAFGELFRAAGACYGGAQAGALLGGAVGTVLEPGGGTAGGALVGGTYGCAAGVIANGAFGESIFQKAPGQP
jgi:RHS repeat-associated protein